MKIISVKEYFELKNTSEYDVFIDIIKAENKLCGKTFDASKLTFNEFKTIISIFNRPKPYDLLDLFIHLYRIYDTFEISAKEKLLNENIFQFFRAMRFVKLFMLENIEIEDKMLYSEPDTRMIEINAYDRLAPFGTMLTKIKLAEQFGKTPEEIGNWKYTEVRNILASNNISNQIQKEYARHN